MKKINKILIANRGEIALRIIRACKELAIQSVAIYSEVDNEGVWVLKADESHLIKGDVLQAYLNYETIISIAKKTGCDAIHPGYGFLSENADFAKACEENGIIFIGPKAEHIALFGDKMASKVAMRSVGVPVLEGTDEPIIDKKAGAAFAARIGFPVIIKAAFGGGGRGMRIVHKEKDFESMFDSATAESMKFFGRSEVFIEKYVVNPRHIEIQIVADKYGNVVHLGERDCSIQRRHQKVIEIAPSPRLSEEARRELYRISTKAMFKLGYESVGTIEFLLDENDTIYFIEMNTRVQVEHPVTETISGIDIIQRMIEIAAGDRLKFLQEEIKFRGYAIEFRINAENPEKNFMPTVGTVAEYIAPGGPGVRLDTSLYAGYTVPANYDSMVGKLIVSALDWEGTVNKARRALDEFFIEGFPTNIPLHQHIVRDEDFINGKFTTNYLDEKLPQFNVVNPETQKKIEGKLQSILSRFLF
ncbi:acetyl-CoA carboxylase biotin carboxylase subunit [Sulfurovum sp.]|jgi:pyruvate carboxylase subunit A|uniref:acetyl-CoA carboxylase biotin carboxylase subunit n=1 Tax=Sulfurovum sp. TaxID=1969726 RepID=UPI002A35A053|nr:acetyl-CoA carboxylase biotin carboxylase subunit [Sulfurovum sp.]MDD2451831.1 acetyl-CoA carboxylase biotin carboxylase subunit [Sulfurovum sp.]MDD3499638.1 acetyl-CoA carboxylase biotin carboxylase subunit [Sulfurovum sp.]MDY0403767.1 acetyl-CoA carboxylase biotin carboxylase subunit [Sulfurovum sp.]